MKIHAERRRRTAEVAALDPAIDWHEIYRRLTLWELPSEARFGFQLAFYRPFAVPRMAAVLAGTGHFRRETTRRAYDTALVVHEIIWGGPDSERGQQMVRLMNKLHDRPDIHAEDMAYILNSLIVVPTRFMDRYGWRRVTEAERTATWRFYDTLGVRMGIARRPVSYADSVQQFQEYEARHLAPSTDGAALTEAVLATLRDRVPAPARPFAPHITSSLVGDAAVSQSLSLPAPIALVAAFVRLGAAARKQVQSRQPPPQKPSFWPGRPAGRLYPDGYTLDQLGPNQR